MNDDANHKPDDYVQIAVRRDEIPDLLNDLLPLDHDAFGATHDLVRALQAARSSKTPGTVMQPRRGDAFEVWLRRQRDASADYPEAYQATDGLLDLYRLHADTGTFLSEHVCEGRVAGNCECLESARVNALRPEGWTTA